MQLATVDAQPHASHVRMESDRPIDRSGHVNVANGDSHADIRRTREANVPAREAVLVATRDGDATWRDACCCAAGRLCLERVGDGIVRVPAGDHDRIPHSHPKLDVGHADVDHERRGCGGCARSERRGRVAQWPSRLEGDTQ